MSTEIKNVIDFERGCGWRKEKGLYMMASGISTACGKLPFPVTTCPTCHAGIKVARGFAWWNPQPFLEKITCKGHPEQCFKCPCSDKNCPDKAGLMWIGEKFYPHPEDWTREAMSYGVSRRIPRVPKDFVIGETWVFAAHRKAILHLDRGGGGDCPCSPGVFHVFRPDRIEYITTGKETEEELTALAERGITPVKVTRAGQLDLPNC